MTQFYSDESRESEPHALPNMEVFFVDKHDAPDFARNQCDENIYHDDAEDYIGWYWWSCFPGCLPDSEPSGPFDSEQAAINDAREF